MESTSPQTDQQVVACSFYRGDGLQEYDVCPPNSYMDMTPEDGCIENRGRTLDRDHSHAPGAADTSKLHSTLHFVPIETIIYPGYEHGQQEAIDEPTNTSSHEPARGPTKSNDQPPGQLEQPSYSTLFASGGPSRDGENRERCKGKRKRTATEDQESQAGKYPCIFHIGGQEIYRNHTKRYKYIPQLL